MKTMKTGPFWAAAIALGMGASGLLMPSAAMAQYTVPGSDDPFPKSDVDPSKPGMGRGGFDPMSLIHNANLSRSRSGADFAEDTERTLNKAADQFKKMQQQRLQETPLTPPTDQTAPVPSP